MKIKTYKGFQFKYCRGNAERESSYDIYHQRRRVARGENLKDCYRVANDLLAKPNMLELRKFLLGDRLLTKRAPDAPKRGAKVVKSKPKVKSGRARR